MPRRSSSQSVTAFVCLGSSIIRLLFLLSVDLVHLRSLGLAEAEYTIYDVDCSGPGGVLGC